MEEEFLTENNFFTKSQLSQSLNDIAIAYDSNVYQNTFLKLSKLATQNHIKRKFTKHYI